MPRLDVEPGGTPFVPEGITKKLYLDDVRNPVLYDKVCNQHGEFKTRYMDPSWDIVRNYDEFVAYIEKNGMPDMISFDHDLAPLHYINLQGDYTSSLEIAVDKSGYDCVKYIVENNLPIKYWACHSMNPYGSMKIISELIRYEARQGEGTELKS
jgi:hypothetical protein